MTQRNLPSCRRPGQHMDVYWVILKAHPSTRLSLTRQECGRTWLKNIAIWLSQMCMVVVYAHLSIVDYDTYNRLPKGNSSLIRDKITWSLTANDFYSACYAGEIQFPQGSSNRVSHMRHRVRLMGMWNYTYGCSCKIGTRQWIGYTRGDELTTPYVGYAMRSRRVLTI